MTDKGIYTSWCENKAANEKRLAVLVDPDKADIRHLEYLKEAAALGFVDYFFIGGSLLTTSNLNATMQFLKKHTSVPLVLFPGSTMQIHRDADGILFLSLISGRNPDLLIGKHVEAAPILATSNTEIIPTGYIIIDGGKATAASYMSNTQPIPIDKPEIAVCTAMAGEMLGLKCIYLEAGSGALNPVPTEAIKQIRKKVSVPIIAGGGIRDVETAKVICEAGADILVVGTKFENDPSTMESIFNVIRSTKSLVC